MALLSVNPVIPSHLSTGGIVIQIFANACETQPTLFDVQYTFSQLSLEALVSSWASSIQSYQATLGLSL